MGKRSYVRDSENFYEGDASIKPKINALQFTENSNLDLIKTIDITPITNYLIENEERIKAPWQENKKGIKVPSPEHCNSLIIIVYNRFCKHNYRLMDIYNEIVEFFKIDYKKFYRSLSKNLQLILTKELQRSMDLSTYNRLEKKKQMKRGGISGSLL